MQPATEPISIARLPSVQELLRTKGFHQSAPDSFTNGSATVHFAGNVFSATPGTPGRSWCADLTGADEQTALTLLNQILGMPQFVSEAAAEATMTKRREVTATLSRLSRSIGDAPESASAVHLRKLLWSLYNGHHLVNLWAMAGALDSEHSRWASEVFSGVLSGLVTEGELKRALTACGEMTRWESQTPSNQALENLVTAERSLEAALKDLPPSYLHAELASILRKLSKVNQEARDPSNQVREV
jgi:hypothetical protein